MEGVLNSLSSVVKNLRDEDLSKRWELMRKKLQQELKKPKDEREVFTPPAIVSVKVGRIEYAS
ncbi:MAG: hypothetical protein QXL24_05560 [Candidatus Jordarchaeaceae archaeon]